MVFSDRPSRVSSADFSIHLVWFCVAEMKQAWKIQNAELKAKVSILREKAETVDKMSVVAQILNMRDSMLQQILTGLLYKKTVIWTDLKINPGGSRDNGEIYASEKVFQIQNKLDEFMQNLGYLPNRYTFKPIDPDEPGTFTKPEVSEDTQFTDFMSVVIDSHGDMETLIKEKFLFSNEKIQGFLDTNPVQATLREKVEELKVKIEELELQNRQA